MAKVYFLLGSNLPDRIYFLQTALKLMESKLGVKIDESSVYETEPWGYNSNSLYNNQVVLFETNLSPSEVLYEILKIEQDLGRNRNAEIYENRTIDIDILFYDDLIIDEPDLKIPHPRLHLRKFALIPMKEISPDYKHPKINKTITELFKNCSDNLVVKELSKNL